MGVLRCAIRSEAVNVRHTRCGSRRFASCLDHPNRPSAEEQEGKCHEERRPRRRAGESGVKASRSGGRQPAASRGLTANATRMSAPSPGRFHGRGRARLRPRPGIRGTGLARSARSTGSVAALVCAVVRARPHPRRGTHRLRLRPHRRRKRPRPHLLRRKKRLLLHRLRLRKRLLLYPRRLRRRLRLRPRRMKNRLSLRRLHRKNRLGRRRLHRKNRLRRRRLRR